MTWYIASTRSKLTRARTDRPAHRICQEQLEGGIERTTANRRDDTLSRQHSIMTDAREIVRENPRFMTSTIKNRLTRIFQNALHIATNWSCGRADNVMLRRYNMPESFSSRPSKARASQGHPARSASMGENTRTCQDTALLCTSSRITVEPSRPESSRQPPRATPDDAWNDDDAGFNSNMPPPHPIIGHDSYYTYDQAYEQPQSYNLGPSQSTYDPMMDFLYTNIGTSQIPDTHQDSEIRDHFIPSPPNLRTNPRPTDPLSYPSDHIYRGRARKQPRR